MSNVPKNVKDTLVNLGFDSSDYWSLPIKGRSVTILHHKAIERIAASRGVVLDPPQIIEADGANKHATILVVGHFNEKTEWSFGEASPQNNKNPYPWAMAEKRAKDRVVLKLIGLHGDCYSSTDDFNADSDQDNQAPRQNATAAALPTETPKQDNAHALPPQINVEVIDATKIQEITTLAEKANIEISVLQKMLKQSVEQVSEERFPKVIEFLNQKIIDQAIEPKAVAS